MAHNIDLILTFTAGLTVALVLGLLALRLKLPPIVGYLLGGVILGPYTPGFVAHREFAEQLAEIGVILLMFGVGLHFHLKDLLAVRRVAISGALCQIVAATALGAVAGRAFEWTWPAALVFGVALSVASTVVLTRVLSVNRDLSSHAGRIAIGWLVVEDIFTVFVLVLLPALFGAADQRGSLAVALGIAALKLGGLIAVVLLAGSRLIPAFLTTVARTNSRELFTLAVLALALGIAVGSATIFGVSMALGAFLAGMVVGQSEFSSRAASEALPMRDAFAVLFFISVGMLFDPAHLVRAPWMTLATIGVILLAKPFAAIVLVLALGYGVRISLKVGVALAQIGEFSFLVAALGNQLKILPPEATASLIAASIVTITLNPLLYRLVPRVERVFLKRFARASESAPVFPTNGRGERAIVVGYGPVGQTVSHLLRQQGIVPTVIELNIDTVRRLRTTGIEAVYGDAATPDVLNEAGVSGASTLIIAATGSLEVADIVESARRLNPQIRILARSAFISTAGALREAGADQVFSGEAEVAIEMTQSILWSSGATPEQMDADRERVRSELYGREVGRSDRSGP